MSADTRYPQSRWSYDENQGNFSHSSGAKADPPDLRDFRGSESLHPAPSNTEETPAAAALGTLLRLKPVLQIQGEKLDAFASLGLDYAFIADFDEMKGVSAIGCISDTDPQPLLIRSHLGTYAICIVAKINNTDELIDEESVKKSK